MPVLSCENCSKHREGNLFFLGAFRRSCHPSKGKSPNRINMETRITNPLDQSKSRRLHGTASNAIVTAVVLGKALDSLILLVASSRIGDLQCWRKLIALQWVLRFLHNFEIKRTRGYFQVTSTIYWQRFGLVDREWWMRLGLSHHSSHENKWWK
jgi:hypothetical protein